MRQSAGTAAPDWVEESNWPLALIWQAREAIDFESHQRCACECLEGVSALAQGHFSQMRLPDFTLYFAVTFTPSPPSPCPPPCTCHKSSARRSALRSWLPSPRRRGLRSPDVERNMPVAPAKWTLAASNSIATRVSARGGHSGMRSLVFLAAMMPAMRVMPSTSPFSGGLIQSAPTHRAACARWLGVAASAQSDSPTAVPVTDVAGACQGSCRLGHAANG